MRIVILFIVTSHCEMGTRKQSTDFCGGGRELVTLKNKNAIRIISDLSTYIIGDGRATMILKF